MKKYVKVLSLLLMILLVFTACGAPVEDAATPENAETEETVENKEDEQAQEAKDDFKAQISFSGSSTLAPVISKISTNFLNSTCVFY